MIIIVLAYCCRNRPQCVGLGALAPSGAIPRPGDHGPKFLWYVRSHAIRSQGEWVCGVMVLVQMQLQQTALLRMPTLVGGSLSLSLSRRPGVCPALLPSPSVQALQVEFNLTTPSVAIRPDGGTGPMVPIHSPQATDPGTTTFRSDTSGAPESVRAIRLCEPGGDRAQRHRRATRLAARRSRHPTPQASMMPAAGPSRLCFLFLVLTATSPTHRRLDSEQSHQRQGFGQRDDLGLCEHVGPQQCHGGLHLCDLC